LIPSRAGKGFSPSPTMSRSALGSTQTLLQWAPGALSPGVKQLGSEADYSHPSSAKVKNA